MIKIFEKSSYDPALGVTFDFSKKSEIIVIGSAEAVEEYARNGMKAKDGTVMVHKCALGSLAGNVNEIMKRKSELEYLRKTTENLCDVNAYCNGKVKDTLKELAETYHNSDHCNYIKNFMIYSFYCAFMRHFERFNKNLIITKSKVHETAETIYIPAFKTDAEKLFLPFKLAFERGTFYINNELFVLDSFSHYSVYKYRGDGETISMYAANGSYITFMGMYLDLLNNSGKYIDNCEICGKLIYRGGKNNTLVCKSPECKKAHENKITSDSRQRSRENIPDAIYMAWSNKCLGYKRMLKGDKEHTDEFNLKLNEYREILKGIKSGLSNKSSKEELDKFREKCQDYAEELQAFAGGLADEKREQEEKLKKGSKRSELMKDSQS